MPIYVCSVTRFVTNLAKLFDGMPIRRLIGWRTSKRTRIGKGVWTSSSRSVSGEFPTILSLDTPWSRNSVNLKERILSQFVFVKSFLLCKKKGFKIIHSIWVTAERMEVMKSSKFGDNLLRIESTWSTMEIGEPTTAKESNIFLMSLM